MATLYYVNVWEILRCYGGPEEGGWWYNAGAVRLSKPIGYNESEAIKQAGIIADQLHEDAESQYYMGINCEDGCDPDGFGDDAYLTRGGAWGESNFDVRVQTKPAEDFPAERPHYE